MQDVVVHLSAEESRGAYVRRWLPYAAEKSGLSRVVSAISGENTNWMKA